LPDDIRQFDWSATPLGPKTEWSAALQTTYDIMMSSGFAMCATWGPEMTLLYNDSYIPFLADRHPSALGRPIQDVWYDVWDDIRPLVETAMTGEPVRLEDLHLVMSRKGYPEETYWTFSYSPLRDGDQIMGILDIAFETTERVASNREQARTEAALREAVEQRTLLAHELQHRVKNILAMVGGVAHQTFRPPATLASATAAFEARLQALARAQDLLTRESWSDTDIEAVVRNTLAEVVPERLRVAGPKVALPARPALVLGLALHELMTNAMKYGALSTEDGSISLEWTLDPTGMLQVLWSELDGPPVRPPARKGFGSRLITSVLAAEFHGSVDLRYPTEGVRFTLTAPCPVAAPHDAPPPDGSPA
jgi:two-component sensor histidine kinase